MSLVCWSGGTDSTLVLWQLAQKSSKADPVRTISIRHPQVWAWEQNKAARIAILKELKARGCHVSALEVTVAHGSVEGSSGEEPGIVPSRGGGLTQPLLWVPTAMMYLTSDESLYLGYVKGDDVWRYYGWLFELFTAMKSFRGLTGALQLPLQWHDKPQVYDELEKAGLLALTWTCENPTEGRACVACHPCEVRIVTEAIRSAKRGHVDGALIRFGSPEKAQSEEVAEHKGRRGRKKEVTR